MSDSYTTTTKRLALRLKNKLEKVVARKALNIHRELVVQTPIDTGQAISNWTASLIVPSQAFVGPYAAGYKGSTWNQNTTAAISQGAVAFAGYHSGLKMYTSNNAPYIGMLNRGWSKQAPSGYIMQAIVTGLKRP